MPALSLDQFRSAYQSGGLESVGVTAEGGQFFITATPRTGDRIVLATTRGKTARGFRDPGRAIAVLHDLGARKLEVDLSGWSPEQAATEGRRRPDTAERQRRAHQAAAHDAWFRAEVEQGLKEADDPATVWIPHDEMEREAAERRANWLAQAQQGK